ncbi:hypothetical protein [Mammaliicoccus sciuri]|uniref:hypothetical protein n=1 Tax=Mammaliicoccus sciuri TaxID=1296 RepID=UPI0018E109D6|nr:hypothetical protein [Mammaliicoccus sciuri]QQC96580.1 hypothetical protein JCQ35_06050 [Mammaliicoccus sciuri]
MAYEYKEEIKNHIICAPVYVDDEVFDELEEVYAKAKAFDEIEKSIIQIKCNYKGNEERINKFIARETEYIMDRKDK